MIEELPNFAAVTLEEAIEWADENLAPRRERPSILSQFVAETNAERAQAQIEYKAAPVEVAGVTFSPGDCVHVTRVDGWSFRKPAKRALNCVFKGQSIRGDFGRRERILTFTQFGAKEGGWPKTFTIYPKAITAIEKVETPAWVTKKITSIKERGY
jgi:hypothetical protein